MCRISLMLNKFRNYLLLRIRVIVVIIDPITLPH
jgi:hypothetical protein